MINSVDILSLEQLRHVLQTSWSNDTSFLPDEWSIDNPARGQCVVSSLVIQDYFGGSFNRYHVVGDGIDEIHYCNLLTNGTVVDTTAMQYGESVTCKLTPIDLKNFANVRDKLISDPHTKYRYELLKKRVVLQLDKTASNKKYTV